MKALKAIAPGMLCTLIAASAFGQDPTQYQYVVQQKIRPGAIQQYEDFIEKLVDAAKEVGNVQQWAVLQMGAGGPGNSYIIVLPHDTWAERDTWNNPRGILVAAHGEEEADKILRAGNASIESSRTMVSRHLPEMSSSGSPGELAPRYLVSRTTVKPEGISDYLLAVSKIRAAEAKAPNAPHRSMRRYTQGANVYTFVTATPFQSGADRDKWPSFDEYMSEAYSEGERGQIMEMLRNSVESRTVFELMYRPDLSHSGDTTTSN